MTQVKWHLKLVSVDEGQRALGGSEFQSDMALWKKKKKEFWNCEVLAIMFLSCRAWECLLL